MAKRPNLIPSIQLEVHIPQDLYTQLTLHLFSELEGRVPFGAYRAFFSERIREFFLSRRLDLAPFAGCPPNTYFISGTPAALEMLELALKEKA